MKIPGQGPGQVVCPAPSAGSMARAGSQAGRRSRARAGRDQAGRLAVIGVVTEDNRPLLRHRAGGAEGVAIIEAAAAGGAVARARHRQPSNALIYMALGRRASRGDRAAQQEATCIPWAQGGPAIWFQGLYARLRGRAFQAEYLGDDHLGDAVRTRGYSWNPS